MSTLSVTIILQNQSQQSRNAQQPPYSDESPFQARAFTLHLVAPSRLWYIRSIRHSPRLRLPAKRQNPSARRLPRGAYSRARPEKISRGERLPRDARACGETRARARKKVCHVKIGRRRRRTEMTFAEFGIESRNGWYIFKTTPGVACLSARRAPSEGFFCETRAGKANSTPTASRQRGGAGEEKDAPDEWLLCVKGKISRSAFAEAEAAVSRLRRRRALCAWLLKESRILGCMSN